MALRLRRGTDAERLLITPLQGEPIFTTDTKKLYVGDGSTVGGVLVTGDQSNTQVSADTNPQLGGDLDLNGNNITGAGNIAIDGTITATGSINLGDGDDDNVAVSGLINTNLRPAIDGAYDVGTSLRRWNNVWAEGANISGQLTADSLSVEKIVSQDSTVLYEAVSNTVTANFVGNVTGDLTGDANGNHTGTFTGAFTGVAGITHSIPTLQSTDVEITGGTLSNVDIGSDTYSNVNIVAEEVKAKDGFFGELFGSVTGSLQGSLQGNVFAEDSTIMVDGENNILSNGQLSITNDVISTTFSDNITMDVEILNAARLHGVDGSLNSVPSISVEGLRGTPEAPASVQVGDYIGQVTFTAYDGAGSFPKGIITAQIDNVTGTNALPGKLILSPHDYDGNYTSLTVTIDSRGTLEAPTMKVTPYADATARDAAIPSPEAGMIVYITSTNKHQGYNGTTWNDFY